MTQKFSISLHDKIFNEVKERESEELSRSGVIARDLSRLYTLYRYAKLTLREQITENEMLYICKGLSQSTFDATTATAQNIKETLEIFDPLREAPEEVRDILDRDLIFEKLDKLDRLQCLALIDAVERFLKDTENEDDSWALDAHLKLN